MTITCRAALQPIGHLPITCRHESHTYAFGHESIIVVSKRQPNAYTYDQNNVDRNFVEIKISKHLFHNKDYNLLIFEHFKNTACTVRFPNGIIELLNRTNLDTNMPGESTKTHIHGSQPATILQLQTLIRDQRTTNAEHQRQIKQHEKFIRNWVSI